MRSVSTREHKPRSTRSRTLNSTIKYEVKSSTTRHQLNRWDIKPRKKLEKTLDKRLRKMERRECNKDEKENQEASSTTRTTRGLVSQLSRKVLGADVCGEGRVTQVHKDPRTISTG